MPERILVVEDEPLVQQLLALNLTHAGHQVQTAGDFPSGLTAICDSKGFALAIVDAMLPGGDGFALIKQARARSVVFPILMLTARNDTASKVRGLDAGADDYLTKPFGIEELLARLRAAQRRSGAPVDGGVVRTEHFDVDLGRKQVVAPSGEEIHLTPTEWGVLECLVRARGLLVPGPELLREVWGPQYETQTNYLRVYLAQLRHKLEPDQGNPRYLITSPGLGYRFDASGSGT